MHTTIDQTTPAAGAKWKFDEQVTAAFDDMLSRSVPDYATMRRLVFDLGSRFVQKGTDIVDLGSSRGAGLAPFVDRFGSLNRHIAVDEAGPMLDSCRERFGSMIDVGVVKVIDHNLAEGQRLIADVYRATVPGGALIFVEKTIGDSADLDSLLVDSYYDHKRANGYSEEQIQSKRQSLRGVLMPFTASANEALLRSEGFNIQPFWRALNFCGWLAIKSKAGA